MTSCHLLLSVLLWPLLAPATSAAPRPAAPASTTASTTAAPTEATLQALICSQVVDVLPYDTFRRQYFDAWTTCRCVSQMRATCAPETFYPTVTPGTPSAIHSMEQSTSASPAFTTILNAFSIQQTCFFDQLRGRTCAFSWEKGSRPACDCAQRMNTATGETPIVDEVAAASTAVASDAVVGPHVSAVRGVDESSHLRQGV